MIEFRVIGELRQDPGHLLLLDADGQCYDYDVAASRNKTDVVAAFVAACKEFGIKPGFYYCILDPHNEGKFDWDSMIPAQYFELIHLSPAGSLSASGADMAKFMLAHLNGGAGLLRPETARLMHDYRAPGIGPLNRMALGFYEQQVNGHRAIGHGGDTDWFHSQLMLFPDAHTGFFLSVNSAGTPGTLGAISTELFHQFADRYLPGEPPVGAVDTETARAHGALLAGHYVGSRTGRTNFMSVSQLFGQVALTVDEQGRVSSSALKGMGEVPISWTEVEPFVWRDPSTGERLAATVEQGRVTRVGLDGAPFLVLEPAPWTINAAGWVPAWLAAVLVLLLTGLMWPAAALLRRYYGAPPAWQGRALRVYRAAAGH